MKPAANPRHTSIWFFYFVAGSLGTSFLLTLVVLAWDSAVDNKTREFAYESLTVDDTVASNVRAANLVLENIASLMETSPGIDDAGLRRFIEQVVGPHEFISTVGYYRQSPEGAGLRLVFANMDGATGALPPALDFVEHSPRRIAVATALRTTGVVPTTSLLEGDASGYVLLRGTVEPGADGRAGLLAMVIDPVSLIGLRAADPELEIHLYSESEGLGGRQLLYRQGQAAAGASSPIQVLRESSVVRFDEYSVRLISSKALYWSRLDKAPIVAALVLGGGVTLLLLALARAKELQARELLARNAVIEEQVRRQTEELALARDEALKASQVKSEFLASMSHEIRTPLNAIIGMAELLAETDMSDDQQKYVGIFRNAGEALLSLVNDILDLSKIEARQLVLEQIDFDVREIIEQSVDIHALKTDAKGIELVGRISPEVPVSLKGDPSRLRQIILNLIGNAIKFTAQGEVVVEVERVGGGGEHVQLRFAIADTGIGIPADKLESIFGSFTQVDSSTTRKYGGTGLGLTISKELVELMGGRIWAESDEGRGSTFLFEADFARGEGAEDPTGPDPGSLIAGLRVLVADDNEANRLTLAEMLEGVGAEVTVAAGGREAIDLQQARRGRGDAFGLVLCDARMPDVDGFAVARSILADDAATTTTILLMLSSSGLAGDLDRAKRVGITHYLAKPVKRAELFGAIERAMGRPRGPVTAVPAAAAGGRRAAVLLVEDNPDNRLLIKAYLKREPFDITEAENGREAVEKFKQGAYDIVLMDVQMPVMDGHQATRAIRAWEQEQARSRTPIVALTAHAVREEMDKSLAAGCDTHLTKPIKKQTLLTSLAEYLV